MRYLTARNNRSVADQLIHRASSDRRWSRVSLYTGMIIVGLISLAALLAPWIAPYGEREIDLLATFQPPSFAHWLGTDDMGRDIFSRVLYGVRLDLQVVLVITYAPLLVGLLLGAVAGYFGGWVDTIINRAVDTVMAIPFLVLVIVVVAIIGPGLEGVFIGVMGVGWALYARLARADMLVIREEQYILAAKGLGYSTGRVLLKHAVPNLLRSSLVFSVADIVLNMVLLAGVSYLGLGVQPPVAELGVIIADGQPFLLYAWWITTLPGLVFVLLGIGFSLIGDGLADMLGEEFKLTV